jgi:hypothetical protein
LTDPDLTARDIGSAMSQPAALRTLANHVIYPCVKQLTHASCVGEVVLSALHIEDVQHSVILIINRILPLIFASVEGAMLNLRAFIRTRNTPYGALSFFIVLSVSISALADPTFRMVLPRQDFTIPSGHSQVVTAYCLDYYKDTPELAQHTPTFLPI